MYDSGGKGTNGGRRYHPRARKAHAARSRYGIILGRRSAIPAILRYSVQLSLSGAHNVRGPLLRQEIKNNLETRIREYNGDLG